MSIHIARLRRTPLFIALVASASCGILTSSDKCGALSRPAITLYVIDSITGVVPSAPSTVIATMGARVDTISAGGTNTDHAFNIGFDLAGVYSLVAKTPGYRDWMRSGIAVNANNCGDVSTVSITARAVPQ